MHDSSQSHLTTDELELWSQGLLDAARAIHLAECSLCLSEGERERKLVLALVQLPRFAPSPGFADRVMARVKVPSPSGGFQAS